jgi:hypothetical protein
MIDWIKGVMKVKKTIKVTKFDSMIGRVFRDIKRIKVEDQDVVLFFEGWKSVVPSFAMGHEQNCCEEVYLESIDGDLNDLIDERITQAECVTESEEDEEEYESQTWSFYKFATNKGSVTMRWIGTSNGFYSEEVDLVEVTQYKNHRYDEDDIMHLSD